MTYQYTPRIPVGYTPVPMHKLDYARNVLKNKLSELNANTGTAYSCKAWYVGPRPTPAHYKCKWHGGASTSKKNAFWAKLAIYDNKRLIGYV